MSALKRLRSVVDAGVLERARYEVIPTTKAEASVLEWVPRDLTVTVTASPGKGIEATLDLTESLARHGYDVVPHLSARLVRDEAHLKEIVARLVAAGVSNVFVPAGDADPPVGEFEGALEVLRLLDEMGRPFGRMGITGYPESHPIINDDVTIQAMWDKRLYADYIVSNLCFDPSAVRRFVARVRARGVSLPILVGIAAPVERTKLLSVAGKIGVGESAKFLTSHAGWFLRLGAPGGYSPDRLLDRLAGTLTDPASGIEGLHVFTFNQLRETEQWRRQLLERYRALRPPGTSGG